jgi:hypothetical protein
MPAWLWCWFCVMLRVNKIVSRQQCYELCNVSKILLVFRFGFSVVPRGTLNSSQPDFKYFCLSSIAIKVCLPPSCTLTPCWLLLRLKWVIQILNMALWHAKTQFLPQISHLVRCGDDKAKSDDGWGSLIRSVLKLRVCLGILCSVNFFKFWIFFKMKILMLKIILKK